MSTILHPTQTHAWWYAAAAAALATGLLVVLITTVFGSSGTEVVTPPPALAHGHVYAPPCFAGHPGGGSIELSRSGCRV
jgi:hypothetical protein